MRVNCPAFRPLVQQLTPAPEPEEVLLRMCRLPHCIFLDSALRHPRLGRYSFVAADPFDYLQVPAEGTDGLGLLARRLADKHTAAVAGLPPFQGGAAGLFSYDLHRCLEKLPPPRIDEFQVPAMAVGLYDVVVAFDHGVEKKGTSTDIDAGRAWVISQGLPEVDPARRQRRAARRLDEVCRLLAQRSPLDRLGATAGLSSSAVGTVGQANRGTRAPDPDRWRLPVLTSDQLAPQHPCQGPSGMTSNFSRADYLRALERVIRYIVAGDVFQVNLSQRLLYPAADDSVALYLRLRKCNPAPFAGYFDLGEFQIVSASPERFLRLAQGDVETRPIKGTRRRSADAQADQPVADQLRRSPKDQAENVMIVDLLRNDLSRVCGAESVYVSQLCEVEAYEHVLHLVSAVRGRLRDEYGPLDLLRAAFPGGSVTGAPKIRAMEIIAELEPTARGPYCGSLGYVGCDGSLDLNILIRTITAGRGWWQAPVGGGIVAQSDPEQEYQETWDKAEGLIQAMVPS